VAESVARVGLEAHVFSLEESRDDLVLKLLSKHARVNSKRLLNSGKDGLNAEEWQRIVEAIPVLEGLLANIRIDDTAGLHVGQIRQRAIAHRDRTMAQFKRPVGLVALDYLQKAKPAPEVARQTKREQIVHATDELKALAKHMRIPVMALAQQKPTEVDKFTKVRPYPDTNSIEGSAHPGREADRLLFLHRMPLRRAGKIMGEDPSSILCIVPKARGGETGEVLLRFEREYSTFMGENTRDTWEPDGIQPLVPPEYRDRRSGPEE
jgi:replicative DNA helicase